jgi:hypothetical protein
MKGRSMKIHIISAILIVSVVAEAFAMRGPQRDFDRPEGFRREFKGQASRRFQKASSNKLFQGRFDQGEGQRFGRQRGGRDFSAGSFRRSKGALGGDLRSRQRFGFKGAGLRRQAFSDIRRARLGAGLRRGNFVGRRFDRSRVIGHRRGVLSPVHRAFLRREFRGHPWSWWFRNRPAVVFNYWIKRRPAFFFRNILPIYIREYYVSDDPAAGCLRECVENCYGSDAPGAFEEGY